MYIDDQTLDCIANYTCHWLYLRSTTVKTLHNPHANNYRNHNNNNNHCEIYHPTYIGKGMLIPHHWQHKMAML